MVELTPPRSPLRWIRTALVIAFFVLVVVSLFTTTLPTAIGIQLSLGIAAIVGLAAAWWSRPGGALNMSNPRANWARNPWVRIPAFGLAMFGLAYCAVAYGVIALAAAAIGQPTSRTLTITGASTSGGGNARISRSARRRC